LLGGEQSGFITDIGFETYHRILDEAIQELKEKEFKEFYSSIPEQPKSVGQKESGVEDRIFVSDCQIDTDMEILITDHYVENISERIRLYRELDKIKDEKTLQEFQKELEDRFGEIPASVKELLNVVRLRWLAINLGFETIIIKNNIMIAHFISNQESPFYESPVFRKILHFVQMHPRKFEMKQKTKRLTLRIGNIKDIHSAINILSEIDKYKSP
jgi:transcription-repair coupling factor (superfamily II helicase)